ncbi:MAG: transporter, partial [Marinobacter sp.]
MTTKLPWLVPVVFAATPLVAEAAPSDRDTASTDDSTSVTAPERGNDPATDIASITADRGIVTRPGRFTIEPSFSHALSNSTAVAVEGYTVIPALLIGLINISEIQRDIFVSAMSLKYGFTSKLEAAIRVPYLSINEDL